MARMEADEALLARVGELAAQGLGYRRIAAALRMKLGTASWYLARHRGKSWAQRPSQATGWAKQPRYLVLGHDPMRRADRRICHQTSRREAEHRAGRLNAQALAERPDAHPWEVPLYYVCREMVDVKFEESETQ